MKTKHWSVSELARQDQNLSVKQHFSPIDSLFHIVCTAADKLILFDFKFLTYKRMEQFLSHYKSVTVLC